MSKTLLALFGEKGSGKSTTAQVISRLIDVGEMAFATPLKTMAESLGYPRHVLHGPSREREYVHPGLNLSARRFLQIVGEAFRKEDPHIWANYLIASVDWMEEDIVLITDLRHPEEFEAVKKAGGIVIGIHGRGGSNDMHPSEVFARENLGRADHMLLNDSDVYALAERVSHILRCLNIPFCFNHSFDWESLKS